MHQLHSWLAGNPDIVIPVVLGCITLWAVGPQYPCKKCRRCVLMRNRPDR